ncbi:MAG TPA: HNH endonuclease, partial [Opitutaceae bacterium]|nr:HNH endonuclease [Opitutaceae bacterium]
MKKPSNIFAAWGRRINWKKRVKAVCKPCWEIKYCPYGPLVEQFPLQKEPDSRSCRIFGHDCPVFHVAEPMTETKELRRISREIPRPTQFRVLKRENQICGSCGKSVQDGDIHFDHIIPYSKGGSSEESNIRLLCDSCNQKRSNRFEAEFLVSNFVEHTSDHMDLSFLDLLIDTFEFAHAYRASNKLFPSAEIVSKQFHDGSVSMFEQMVSRTPIEFSEFFSGKRPAELTRNQMGALQKRWGYKD